MFYSFNWVDRPQLIAQLRTNIYNWARDNELIVYLSDQQNPDQPAALRLTPLSASDLDIINKQIHRTITGNDYAGVNLGRDLTHANGYCYFKLNEDRTVARLEGYLADEVYNSLPPGLSPVFQVALDGLLFDLPGLKELYLPIDSGNANEVEVMDNYNFQAGDHPGHWRRFQKPETVYPPEVDQIRQDWIELSIDVEAGFTGVMNRLLSRFCYRGFTTAELVPVSLPNGEQVPDDAAPVILHGFVRMTDATPNIDNLVEHLAAFSCIQRMGDLDLARRSGETWEDIVAGIQIYRAGRNVVINVPGKKYNPQPGEIVFEINPNKRVFSFFSFGLHPTSTLSLALIEDYVTGDEHHNMLDIGTGSGMLSILAAKLGVGKILAVDAFLPAIEAARENVTNNALAGVITVEKGSLGVVTEKMERSYTFTDEEQLPPPGLAERLPFDVIVCNTYANFIAGLATRFYDSLRPGGLLITSGIHEKHRKAPEEALEKAGFELVEVRELKQWIGLVHLKRPAAF